MLGRAGVAHYVIRRLCRIFGTRQPAPTHRWWNILQCFRIICFEICSTATTSVRRSSRVNAMSSRTAAKGKEWEWKELPDSPAADRLFLKSSPGQHKSRGILTSWLDPEFYPQIAYIEVFATFATKMPYIKFFGAKTFFFISATEVQCFLIFLVPTLAKLIRACQQKATDL